MKQWSTTFFFLSWTLALLVALSPTTCGVVKETEESHENEEQQAAYPQDDIAYDPLHEPPIFACRRDPTWRSLDFDQCQELTEWYEPDAWSVLDHDHTNQVLGEAKENDITNCLADAFNNTQNLYEWSKCDEENRDESCAIDWPFVLGHYMHVHEGNRQN
jgi:hypothetical protein